MKINSKHMDFRVAQVREWLDTPGESEIGEDIETAMDEAQGDVFSDRCDKFTITISVTR